MYVIQRIPDKAFVARSGRSGSYTRKLQLAQTYKTREAANANRCTGNETVVPVQCLLQEPVG